MSTHELIGKVVGERFEIVRVIGQGGMGTVFEARHRTLPRRFAIKILRQNLAHQQEFVERFRREAIAAGRIDHPNIIYITDFGTMADGAVYLVMEYLEGQGLDQLLARDTRLPLNRAIPILAQIADGLDEAHRMEVVHRDLKPENVLLTEVRGRKDVVKLLDFGIARLHLGEGPVYEQTLTIKGQVFGTAEYMSPEQATGEPVDGRSDIYGLGCLAYEMITGDPPFLGPAVRVLHAHVNDPVAPPSTKLRDHPVPSAIDALVLRCLAKNPEHRYQTGAELRQDLIKGRAALFGLGAEQASQRPTGSLATVPRQALTGGWQSLGGRVPELLGAESAEQELAPLDEVGGRSSRNTEQLRDEYHHALRTLALGLVQEALASPETSESLERLLVIQEEVASLTGTIVLAEQNFDRIRFDFGQREKRLRHAMLDLSMTRAQLLGRSEVDPAQRIREQLRDLEFQIEELQKSCNAVALECQGQIQELDAEVKRYRLVREEREQEAAELHQTLHARVEALRPRARTPALLALYEQLDRAVASLERVHPS